MITKEALDAARMRGAQKVLIHYGLDKHANGVLATLGGAASRAISSGTKAYQHGGGNMMQNIGKGIAGGAKGFQRAGGVPAASKALGATAAGGAALYGAGRAFGAGQAGAQKQAEDEMEAPSDLGGIARSTALAVVPGGQILQGIHRGGLHGRKEQLPALGRMLIGSTLGGVAGHALGGALSPRLALLSTILGSGVGGHYATKKYLQPPTAKRPASADPTEEEHAE